MTTAPRYSSFRKFWKIQAKKRGVSDKPDSVLFAKQRAATICLVRPEPGIQAPRAAAHPLFGLAPGGVCKDGANHFGSRRALTPPFHPCRICIRRFVFCCTFLSGAYCPRHPFMQGTPCSAESGLSSSSMNRRLPADTSFRNISPVWKNCKSPEYFFRGFFGLTATDDSCLSGLEWKKGKQMQIMVHPAGLGS